MTSDEVLMHGMIQLNTLYGFENVSDCYYLKGYDVININTGKIKSVNLLNTKRHYPYVTLEQKNCQRNKKALMHHIIALAYIKNEPFEIVEHLNNNQNDYRVENLMFSTQSENIKRAFVNGRPNRTEKIYSVIMHDGKKYTGTMKELSELLCIPRQTIYSRFYLGTPGVKIKNVTLIG